MTAIGHVSRLRTKDAGLKLQMWREEKWGEKVKKGIRR